MDLAVLLKPQRAGARLFTIMVDRPDLRLVADSDEPDDCVSCGKPATTRSAVDNAPLCMDCFTKSHWHPSWSRSFDEPEADNP